MAWPQSGHFFSPLCPKTIMQGGESALSIREPPDVWQNGVGCPTHPGCFSPAGTEQDSLRSLRQRGPRYCPLPPTLTTTPPQPAPQAFHSPAQAWAPGASQRWGGAAEHCGSCSSRVGSAPRRPWGPDSRSQKPPRGRLAQSSQLTCSVDVTVSTESSCNRSRECSGLRLYSGSDQTGEEDGGQQ